MTTFNDITALARGTAPDALTVHEGYAPTGATLPYAVHRPLVADVEAESMSGEVIDWNFQYTMYACAESVEASFNFAMLLMQRMSGAYVSGTTLRTSMGYSGAQVEGHYESQVTIQLIEGAI